MLNRIKTPHFPIGLRIAIRARFTNISLWLLVALVLIVILAAQFSGRQPATVALDVGISFIRISLPLLIVIMIQELFTREFERRYFLSSLTYPRVRTELLLGRFLAVFVLSLLLLVIMSLTLAVLVSIIGQSYAQATPVDLWLPYFSTVLFISVDLFVISAMATLLSIVAVTPSFILIGTFGFLIVARSYATVIALLQQDKIIMEGQQLYQESLSWLGYFLPDLAALDIREVTLYGTMDFLPENWLLTVTGTTAYGVALLGIALWRFERKSFS